MNPIAFGSVIANLSASALVILTVFGASWLVERQFRELESALTAAASERENLLVTLTSIGDAVVVTDEQGLLRLINPVAKQLLGCREELIGKPLADVLLILNESTRQPDRSPVARVLESGDVVVLRDQLRLVRPDGTEVPIEYNAAPIRTMTGTISGIITVFRDCSARQQFEMELKRREQRFRILFETPLIGIAVGTSGGKHLLEANDAYLDLIGYDVGELPGDSLGWGGVEAGQSPLDESAQQELAETGFCHPFERAYTRPDKTVVPVMISASKLLDETDRILVFIADLSSIKQSEAALRDSQQRFHTLSESMPQMVWTARPNGEVDYVNRTLIEYSGRTAEELQGSGWNVMLHDEDREAHFAAWKTALSDGTPLEVEHRLFRRSGEYRWHLTRAVPVRNSDRQITLWVGTNTDIHDQKQLEALLKEEHHRKDQFLALLAHELRNPLAPLGNAVQILSVLRDDPVQSRELVEIMQRQIQQLTRLIDDLLDLARITQGRILLRRERTKVAVVTSAAVESVQPWIDEHRHHLSVTLPDQDLWIDADVARLSQVLTNLLQNAAKYTEPGGNIELIVEADQNKILFRVRDDGPGLSAAMLKRVFELFMQVEQTLDRARGGLGIGLTLVRTLVELHGGSVSAHSDGLGHGCEFIVELPRIEGPDSQLSNVRPSDAADESMPALNVLVVDDVQASAKTLAMMLTTLGQDVQTAYDGVDAIERVTTGSFDVVFLDIAMPGIDGLKVAKLLRSFPSVRRLILIALTGFGQEADRQRSFDAGFDEHLIKPTSIDQLKEVLQRTASSRI
ncbi:MAG: PAS domain S-box protein [Planctomycetes bacterium]|nr:PAS domain S-box protein [Planctomycetota bacterium]